jgi:hypothetical protein
MTDKDRSPPFYSKARTLFVVLSILVIAMVTFFVTTDRPQRAITSKEPPTNTPAESAPVGGVQHSDTPRPTGNSTSTVDICGYGQVPVDKSHPDAVFQQVGALTKNAGTRWLTALQNSDDLRARVAGLLLEGKVTGGEALRSVAEQTRNEVVQLAAGTQDPAVYAMAVSMCDSSAITDPESACRQLSLQHWARLDSDNAVPWLLLAGKAQSRHDNAAEAAAFSHIATAQRMDSYSDSLFAFAEPELSRDVTPVERSYLATEVIGVEAAIRLPQYSVASRHCSSDAMKDSTVRQQCNSLAELLVTKGTNLLDLSLGKAIGARAGWPSERLRELNEERDALMWTIMQQTPSDNDELWTCEAVSRLNAYLAQRVQQGELRAARDALERSGGTMEVLAQKYTQYIDNPRRDALLQEQRDSQKNVQ